MALTSLARVLGRSPDEVEEEIEDEPPKKVPRKHAANAREEGKRTMPTTPPSSGTGIDRSVLQGISLTEAVKQGELVHLVVKEWMRRYKTNRAAAVAEVLTFLNAFCGCPMEVTVEQVREGDTDSLVKDLVDAVIEEGGEDLFTGSAKEKRLLRSNFSGFWDHLVRESLEACVVSDRYLIDKILDHAVGMSGTVIRNFRQIATLSGMSICTSFVKCCLSLESSLEIARKQLSAEVKKKKTSNTSGVAILEKTIEETQKKLSCIQFYLKDIYTRIFAVRYRDRDENTRSACIEGLGSWIKLYPKEYLKDEYLKYLGWSVTDKVASVRMVSLEALSALYEDESNFTSLELFTANFKERFVELARDIDVQVSTKAIYLLTKLLKVDALGTEEVIPVFDLMLEDSAQLRKAAAHLVHEVILQMINDTESRLSRTKSQVDTREGIELRCISEFFSERADSDESVYFFVDALFEKFDVFVKWEKIESMLLTEADKYMLPDRQVTSLLRLLAASARKAIGEKLVGGDIGQKKVKSKIQKETWILNREEMTASMMKNLPCLIRKYQTDAEKIPALMILAQTMDLELYSLKGLEDNYLELLQLLKETLYKHSTAKPIASCARAMISCASRAPAGLGDESGHFLSECSVELLTKMTSHSERVVEMEDQELHLDDHDVFAFYVTLMRLYELQHNGQDMCAEKESTATYSSLAKVLGTIANGRTCAQQVTQFLVTSMLDQLLWRLRNLCSENTSLDLLHALKADCEHFLHSLQVLLCSHVTDDVKDTCFRAMTDVLLLFSVEKHHGTFLEQLGIQPQESTVRIAWDWCLSVLTAHKLKVQRGEDNLLEDEKCGETLLACTRLLVFDAVTSQDWLLVELIRCFTWVEKSAENVLKHMCQALKRSDPERLWAAYFSALECSYDSLKSSSRKDKKVNRETLVELVHFVNAQYRSFGSSRPGVYEILKRGIGFAMSDPPNRVEYLELAMVYFAARVSPASAGMLLSEMESLIALHRLDQNEDAWKSFFTLKEYLEEKASEAPTITTPQRRKILFAEEQMGTPASVHSTRKGEEEQTAPFPSLQGPKSNQSDGLTVSPQSAMPSTAMASTEEGLSSRLGSQKRNLDVSSVHTDISEPPPRQRRRRIR